MFQAINWLLFFYIPEQEEPLFAVGVIKHTFTTTQNMKFCTFYAHQTVINCLVRHYSPTVYYLLQCLFSDQKKNWLCWKCVINYEVRPATFWVFTQHGMVILTTIVLLDP